MKAEYPAKVLLAWGEAIGGNKEIGEWLMKNGYPELGLFRFALLWDLRARQWYYDNGHAELMAMVKGVEGEKNAISWLEHEGYGILANMARAGDGNETAFQKLVSDGHKILALIAKRIHQVKRELDDDRRDPHKFPQR